MFETQTGYSDYFASSMVVMLRAVDVPARLAAGYAPGEFDPENNVRVVRDFDSHGWVQVFFPEYGWIDFEPTPRWPEHERQFAASPEALALSVSGGTDGISDPSEFLDPFDDIGAPGLSRIDGGGTFGSDFFTNIDVVAIGIRTGIVVGAAAAVWLLLYMIWNLGLRGLSTVERGIRAHEQARRAGRLTAQSIPDAQRIRGDGGARARRIRRGRAEHRARVCCATLYTRRTDRTAAGDNDGSGDTDEMEQAWRSIRGALVARAFKRLLPGGNQG